LTTDDGGAEHQRTGARSQRHQVACTVLLPITRGQRGRACRWC
jgi:hypothetical protein